MTLRREIIRVSRRNPSKIGSMEQAIAVEVLEANNRLIEVEKVSIARELPRIMLNLRLSDQRNLRSLLRRSSILQLVPQVL